MATRPPRLSPGTMFCHTGPDGQRRSAFTAEEFWGWGFSNIQEGVTRGILAEFIVARAIGAPVQVRQSWDEADLVTAEGVKIEVKSTGFLQAWADGPAKASRVCFDGVKSRLWTPELGTAAQSDYHSDVYVFCLHTARTRGGYHPLDLDQWEFWVVARRTLAALDRRRIRYPWLKELGASPVRYAGLAAEVARVAREQIEGGHGARLSAPPGPTDRVDAQADKTPPIQRSA